MKKLIFWALTLGIGAHSGWKYITSEKFQQWADQKKAPWTCTVNLMLGGFQSTLSEYRSAYSLYERVLTRCPETEQAKQAEYKMADALVQVGRYWDAIHAFEAYAEKYKGTREAGLATKAATKLRLGM